MAVNSFLVHGPRGVVVVDGQLTVSDAGKVRAAVVATGQPLAGVLITHPHPDHYAGAALIAGDTPILATPAVDAVIRRDDARKADIVGPMFGAQWPAQRRFPDRLVDPGESVELAGVNFHVTDSGPGESHADSMWWLDQRTVFAGDIVYHHAHSYLADGHFAAWLTTLEMLSQQLGADVTLHLGHGDSAGKEVLVLQRRYIEAFLAAVTEYADHDPSTRAAAVTERMRAVLPTERLMFLMELSIEPARSILHSGAR